MSFISKILKAGVDVVMLPVAIVQDVLTLGGIANDGYFENGQHTYTGKRLHDAAESIEEAKDEL